MVKEGEAETEETLTAKAYKMIEAGLLISEICKRLNIQPADYWELKKDWNESKKNARDSKWAFLRLRAKVHERCKRSLILLSGDVAQYTKKGTIEELKRMLEKLPAVRDRAELEADIAILGEKEKEIQDTAFRAKIGRKKNEKKKFQAELQRVEARKLMALYKYAAREGLSRDETLKREKRIRKMYGDKELKSAVKGSTYPVKAKKNREKAPVKEDVKYCDQCGAANRKSAKFCVNCGTEFWLK